MVSSSWYSHFRSVWPGMPKLGKIKSLLFFCNVLRNKWVIKLIFCMQINIQVSYKLILWFWCWWSNIPKVLKIASLQCLHNISKKDVRDEVDFLHADKHQTFLQVDFNTLGINVPYKVTLSLLMGVIKCSQRTQSNKFVITLQYLKKEIRYGAHFLHTYKHQNF